MPLPEGYSDAQVSAPSALCRTHLHVRCLEQLKATPVVADDVVLCDDTLSLGDNAMTAVLIDAVATQLHLALSLDQHASSAVAGNAVVCNACQLAALQHRHPAIAVGMNYIGNDVDRFAALDVQPSSCQPIRAIS